MELKYEVTEEDIVKGTLYNMKISPKEKKDYYKARYLLPVLVGLVLFIFNTVISIANKFFWDILLILLILIWIITFPKFYEKQIRKKLIKMRKGDGITPTVFKQTITIEEGNIKIISKNPSNDISTEEIKKDDIKKIKVFDGMILIYGNNVIPQIVPTRNFSEESKIELLEELGVK